MAIQILKPLYSEPSTGYRDNKTPEEARFYNSARWQKIRSAHRKIEPCCRECAKSHRVVLGQCVDHIVPKRKGGTDDESNLQTLCNWHHDQKRKRESMQ
jgi:5-methylcytosine-specific restriction enzyme A